MRANSVTKHYKTEPNGYQRLRVIIAEISIIFQYFHRNVSIRFEVRVKKCPLERRYGFVFLNWKKKKKSKEKLMGIRENA